MRLSLTSPLARIFSLTPTSFLRKKNTGLEISFFFLGGLVNYTEPQGENRYESLQEDDFQKLVLNEKGQVKDSHSLDFLQGLQPPSESDSEGM